MEILKIEDLSFAYSGACEPSIKKVSANIYEGDFVCICGLTGSGKSTFLKLLKAETVPLGDLSGNIFYKGSDLYKLDARLSAGSIGYVMQRPEEQLVTDKVWHELAFGMENLGLQQSEMTKRIAEISAYFDLDEILERETALLSGGQKQLVNLASVMAMKPEILLLDEPTAQLDPVAASAFIEHIRKLNQELGITIIMVEHRLEEIIPLANRLMIFEDGHAQFFENVKSALSSIRSNSKLFASLPAYVRAYRMLCPEGSNIPINISEGRAFIKTFFSCEEDKGKGSLSGCKEDTQTNKNRDLLHVDNDIFKLKLKSGIEQNRRYDVQTPTPVNSILEFKNVYFSYSRKEKDVLSGFSLSIKEGEIHAVFGGNGAGKTTALLAAAGLHKPYSGSIILMGKALRKYKTSELYENCIGYLPQDVESMFVYDEVAEELADSYKVGGKSHNKHEAVLAAIPSTISNLYDFEKVLHKHPYDLSGGEKQLLGLLKVLARNPKLLLLDEPTKGIDSYSKKLIGEILRALVAEGKTIVLISHDVEFCSEYADRCSMMFKGEIVSTDVTREFFAKNYFYTTSVGKMTSRISEGIVTLDDLLGYFGGEGNA